MMIDGKKLAEEIQFLILQAAPNGTASLYIPFPNQVENDEFPQSLLLRETRLDRLYLLIQIHLLIHEEVLAETTNQVA